MRTLTISFLALLVVLCSTSCERIDDLLQPSDDDLTVEEILASDQKIAFITENYYKVLPPGDADAIARAALSLDADEFDVLTDLDYDRRINLGENKENTELFRDFRRAANKLARERYEKSLFGTNDDEYKIISDELFSSGQYDRLMELELLSIANGRQMACDLGQFNASGYIEVGNSGSGEEQWPMSYIGSVTICPSNEPSCQDDCDLLFRSNRYSQYYFSSNIQATSASARNTLTTKQATAHHSLRVAPNSNEEYLEMAIGTGRVQKNYGFGNADNFANEIKTGLTIR